MKRRLAYATIILLCLTKICHAQEFNAGTQALQAHDLRWIKYRNDIERTGMTAAAMESEIRYVIKSADNQGIAIRDIELPINVIKLEYVGYLHPNDIGIFSANPVRSDNSASINKKLYIYRYDNFYFSTETDNIQSQKNVYYAARAVEILRAKYWLAFERLFTDTERYPSDRPKLELFSNMNKCYWIAFNETPDYIAKSYTSFLGEGYFPDVDGAGNVSRFRNVVVIDIHAKNILGNETSKGSRPIYKRSTADENYTLYMKEGLIETLIHEMIHRYIDYLYPHDKMLSDIRRNRNVGVFNMAEENAVVNTSLSYLLNEGGMGDELFKYYYKEVFQSNVAALHSSGQYEPYARLFADSVTISAGNERKIFRMKVLDR